MANVSGPFGFLQVGTASGPPNFARAGSATPYKIKSTQTGAIFFGDAVRMWVSGDTGTSAAGYVIQWTGGDGASAATPPPFHHSPCHPPTLPPGLQH